MVLPMVELAELERPEEVRPMLQSTALVGMEDTAAAAVVVEAQQQTTIKVNLMNGKELVARVALVARVETANQAVSLFIIKEQEMANYQSIHLGQEIDQAVTNVNKMLESGEGIPTTTTIGTKGMKYLDTFSGIEYECQNVAGSTYTWIVSNTYTNEEKEKVANAVTEFITVSTTQPGKGIWIKEVV